MLSVKQIDSYYGEIQALHHVSMEVGSNEIVALIGANGAGKSTLMQSIMGLVRPKKGLVEFSGKQINGMNTCDIVKLGVVYIPEGREVFPNMTVLENLEMGAYSKKISTGRMNEKLAEVYELFPRLKERQKQKAGSLSGGEQQMLAIARGLMSEPQVLMCDEPSLGLAPVIVDEMFDIIVKVNKNSGIPVLLAEQNAYMALTISSRAYVMENGVIVKQGESKELIESPDIKKAYLGG